MEKYSYDLYQALNSTMEVDLLKNGRGKPFLPFFFITCLYHIIVMGRHYRYIHLADAVLSPLVPVIRLATTAKVSITVHGLDLIYDNFLYQLIVAKSLARADRIVAVSQHTRKLCLLRGIKEDKCYVIPNGIVPDSLDKPVPPIEELIEQNNINVKGRKLLLSVGRLIRRKGMAWFVENVMTRISDRYLLVIVGNGPEKKTLVKLVREYQLEDSVYLLESVSEEEKICLYKNADLFIMPNISVPGDAEGFGISIIEAAASGLAAIASKLEGIPDTIRDGITGTLVAQRSSDGFIDAIISAEFNRDKVRKLTREKFNWSVVKEAYLSYIFC